MAMVILTVDFEVQFAVAVKQREIESVGRFFVLRHGAQAGGVQGFIENPLPIRNPFGMRHHGILRPQFGGCWTLFLAGGQIGCVFREAGQVADARVQRSLTIANHYQFGARSGDGYVEQRRRGADKALIC